MDQEAEVERLTQLVVDLQSQLAFQEQTLSELNDALTVQQQDLAQLKREWSLVQERYESLQDQLPAEPANEKPPHY